jgi:3-oxoacyl-[acyl-carrier protein] reductase
MIPIDLSGKTAIVTGASQGLGAAIAAVLHRSGANVGVNYWPDAQGANQAKAEALIAAMGPCACAVPGDVRDAAAAARMVRTVSERFGGIDILVNNAGIVRDRSFRKMTLDEWNDVLGTNLTGTFIVTKAVEPVLSSGGRIVSLASISAALGFFGQANYAAAKAGVIGMTRVLARELARRAITVNAIAPGVVMTDMALTIPAAERDRMQALIPLGRFGEASDIASAVLFLCSDLSSYITGQTIHVNGGWMPT